jgi:phosphatidylserine/phosphatidylglycerophosphate/cardiolipin synthase-like enzyme
VILGSYNFSESAETRNDENLLIVHDPVFASYFVEEFDTVWNEAAGGVGAAPGGVAALMP